MNCEWYRKCPGCTHMHFPYAKQVRDKELHVKKLLKDFLPTAAEAFKPMIKSPSEEGYRTSTKICLNQDKFGQKTYGIYGKNSKKVIPIPRCPVHDPHINTLLARVVQALEPFPFYQHEDKTWQTQMIKFLTVRYDPISRTFGLVVSHTGVDLKALKEALLAINEPISIYHSCLEKEDHDLVMGSKTAHLCGKPHMEFRIGEVLHMLPPTVFFQANARLLPEFVRYITQGLEGSCLLDLYGGFGAFSYALHDKFRAIYLVESNPKSIAAFNQNALKKPHMHAVKKSVEHFFKQNKNVLGSEKITHIILNPPRQGVHRNALQEITRIAKIQKCDLTYVSCDPITLRRDLRVLNSVYHVKEITAFDMFPQTEHCETVVKLATK